MIFIKNLKTCVHICVLLEAWRWLFQAEWIPLIQQWISDGMSAVSAAAFMITGPATKIINLGALKIALGAKNFVIYLAFVALFSLATGVAVNLVL